MREGGLRLGGIEVQSLQSDIQIRCLQHTNEYPKAIFHKHTAKCTNADNKAEKKEKNRLTKNDRNDKLR